MLKHIYTTDNYEVEHVVNLHTVSSHYALDLGKLEKALIIYSPDYKGQRDNGPFLANGTEIGSLEWDNIADFKALPDNTIYYNNVPMNAVNISILNKGLD